MPIPPEDTALYAAWTLTDSDTAAAVEHLQWEYQDGHILITGRADEETLLAVPASISGYPVTAVASDAFAWTNVKAVILPDSVVSLGSSAFEGCASLQHIALGQITVLPDRALMNCLSLTALQLPDTLTQIGENALNGTGLKTLTIPSGVKLIAASALRHCASLSALNVAEGNAWYESRSGVLFDTVDGKLQRYPSAKAGDSYAVTDTYGVGAWAFEEAAALQTVTLSGDVYSLGEGAFRASGLTAMPTLSAMITRIPDHCFQGCLSLTEAAIPDTVKAIGKYAFANCPLTEIEVPDAVTTLGADAFTGSVLIKGTAGSAAHTFALAHDLRWQAVNAAAVESIAFADSIITLNRGERLPLAPQLSPENADASSLVWMSSDPAVVYVDQTGELLATGGGRALVQATAPNGVTAMIGVIVEVPVTSLTLDLNEAMLPVGETLTLIPALTPLLPTDTTVAWTSSDPDIATVDENGVVTGLADGTAVITATSHNGFTDTCTVRVYVPATSLAFDADAVRVLVGQQIILTPQIQPANATFSSVVWTISDETIASIAADSTLSALAVGETTVTAQTEEGLSAACTVVVCNPLSQMQIDWPENNVFAVGDTLALHAVLSPDHLLSDSISWESSNPDSISVDASGQIAFLRPGLAWITATPEADPAQKTRFELICRGSSRFTLPAMVKTVDEEAFLGIGAELVILPDGVTAIGARAFAQCPNLAEIHIPSSVTSIADSAFDGSPNVAIVGVPGSAAQTYAAAHHIPFFAE